MTTRKAADLIAAAQAALAQLTDPAPRTPAQNAALVDLGRIRATAAALAGPVSAG